MKHSEDKHISALLLCIHCIDFGQGMKTDRI